MRLFQNSIQTSFFTCLFPVLFLAGCFNPITVEPPEGAFNEKPARTAPFTVEINIGDDSLNARFQHDSARTVLSGAGDSMSLINNYANFAQLAALDENGRISYMGESFKAKDAEGAVFDIPGALAKQSKIYLLLMGRWEEGAANPTLLAAGCSTSLSDDENKVLLYMWPIVVKAEINSSLGLPASNSNSNVPVKYNRESGAAELWPADCEIKWTITDGTKTSGDPLAPLIAAQEILAAVKEGRAVPETPSGGIWDGEYSSEKKPLKVEKELIKSRGKNTADGAEWDDEKVLSTGEVAGNVISLDLSGYTAGLEAQFNEGYVYFNFEYVPFNLNDPAAWLEWEGNSEFKLDGLGLPVWIIRNGLNDEAGDENTEFDRPAAGVSNGNGAAAFKVKHRYWAANPSGSLWGEPEAPYDMLKFGGNYFFTDFPEYEGTADTSITVNERDSLLAGYDLKVSCVWDDYERRPLRPEEGGGLLEWEIDWSKSGLLTLATGEISPDDPNCVAPENLTIIRDSSGVQKLKLLTFFNGSVNGSTHRYVIALRGRLEKGFKAHTADIIDIETFKGGGAYIKTGERSFEDGQDYSGSIISYWGNSHGVDFIF
ncbi:MAG: hypothetical protein LBU18_02795 [Treponema sp.]|jgi:hypothetical protein|nr:hypothetical protein [Treponema sp.]